jgi:Ca2+-binding RTX toxin-like protein
VNIGASVTDTPVLYVDGTSVAATYDSATGTLTPSTQLTSGSHALTYTLTDGAGNTSASPALSLTVDTTAPTISTATPPTYKDDASVVISTNTLSNTYDNTPGVNIGVGLTDIPKLYLDGKLVDAMYDSGTGTLTPGENLAPGSHKLRYTLTDAAGNESIPSNSLVINVLRKVTIDNVSSANQPLFISGRAEANAKVALALNNNVTVNVNADHNGNWTYDGSVRYIMIRKTLQPLTDGNSAFDANGILTIGDVSIYGISNNKFSPLLSAVTASSPSGFINGWDPRTSKGSIIDNNYTTDTSFAEAWGKEISINGGNAWVQIDLGAVYPISKITVFARDAFGARLNNAQIFTSVNDMSQKSTIELNVDTNINVLTPITNLINTSNTSINVQKVDFQSLIQTITATETVSSLTNSTNATVNNNATSGNDSITGSSGADFIFGGMGNDTLTGREGLDHIQGGEGADLIFGGIGGSDTIGAGLEGDFLSGDAGDDTLYGSAGSDYIQGGAGSDSINGGLGDDFISGGLGDDTIYGGGNSQWGGDIVSYHNSPSAVSVNLGLGGSTSSSTGGEGNDVLYQIEGVEGSDFNDSIVGSLSDEFLFGSQGNDTILGGGGSDHLQGGEGSDLITAVGSGDNFLSGDQGNDLINGGDGSDHIQGGEGSDSINGGSGDDFISGGLGDDTIYGGGNSQWGGDIVSYHNSSSAVSVSLGMGGGTGSATGGEGNDIIYQIEGVEGSDFNDSIVGSLSDEFLFGSQGNDTILGGGGSDDLQGGEGSDSITGGSGDDFISGDQGKDILIGGGGSDHIQGGEGSDSITAVGSGDNFLSGDQGNDSINGGDGSDHIQGGEGSDLISGGSGDDFISGGAGIDILTGGIGHDIFLFNLGFQSISGSSATDVITDFVHGEDIFDFGIPGSNIRFVSNTVGVSDLTTLLSNANAYKPTTPSTTLCYFGVIGGDGYLVTEDDSGMISNIIQLTGVTSFTISDFVSPQTTFTPIVTQQPTL